MVAWWWTYKVKSCSYIKDYQSFSCVNSFYFVGELIPQEHNGMYDFKTNLFFL